jgi:hypothetical protein
VPILRKLFRELTEPGQFDAWDNLTVGGVVRGRVERMFGNTPAR